MLLKHQIVIHFCLHSRLVGSNVIALPVIANLKLNLSSVRLERRGSGAGIGAEAGDGGSWAEAEDTGFRAEADACPRERPTREARS
jgi:hypothetical protein